MKTVKFRVERFGLGEFITCDVSGDVSGEYVPLAARASASARVAVLEGALLAMVARVDTAEDELCVVVIKPGDEMIEDARKLLGDKCPPRAFKPPFGWNKDNIHLRPEGRKF